MNPTVQAVAATVAALVRWEVLKKILCERDRQNKLWGEQNHDNYRWLAILSEELGEVSQAILHDEFGGEAAGGVEIELVQVAAVALQWLECIERRRNETKEQ